MTTRIKVLFINGLLLFCNICFSQSLEIKSIVSKSDNISIQVVPKLEMLHIMAYLGGSKNLNSFDFQYKSEIDAYFKPFKANNEIIFVNKVLQNYYAQFLINGLIFNDDFRKDSSQVDFLNVSEFRLENNFGNKVMILDSLLTCIDLYSKSTKFKTFVENHKSYYNQKINEVKDAISDVDLVKYNEDFWGIHKDNYQIVICLLEQDIHSYWFDNKNGSNCIFFLSPKFVVGNDATFGNSSQTNLKEGKMSARDFIFYGAGHELGHCFINPIVDKVKVDVDIINFDISTNLDPAKDRFLCESILRSLTAYYMIQNNYAEIAQMVLQMEKQQGFKYNDLILELINDYCAKRSVYKSFDEYVLVLIARLKQSIN